MENHAVAYYVQSKDDIQEEHLKNRKLFEFSSSLINNISYK